MGKTTNSLLTAGEMALEGRVDIEALRTLHLGTCQTFNLPETKQDARGVLGDLPRREWCHLSAAHAVATDVAPP